MSELLSSVVGGGGAFVPTFFSGQINLLSGLSGEFITLTPPAGQRVVLTGLSAISNGRETGITVKIAGVNVITSKELGGLNSNVDNAFVVNLYQSNQTKTGAYCPAIVGGVDEVISVTKDAGSTSQDICYGYQFGVFK